MKRIAVLALVGFSLIIGACSPGVSLPHGQGTPTPTPFLPNFDETAGPAEPAAALPTAVQFGLIPARYEDFPAATALSDIAVPDPVGRFVQPDGQVNILLLGSDQRPDDGGFRTDVILLLTLNPGGKKVSATSFPRDLYVYIPGWRVDRINTAFARGGFEMMADTFEYNFGVRPDHYALVNFWNFETIVDTLGGINVNVAQGLTDERDGPGDFSVPTGSVAMDGETALWYVRSRGTSSDFDRTRREQEVLEGIFHKMLSLDAIVRAPELYDQYKQTVTTDVEFAHILPLLGLATDLATGSAQTARFAVGPEHVSSYTTSGGGAVLLPNRDAVLEIMRQALSVDQQLGSN